MGCLRRPKAAQRTFRDLPNGDIPPNLLGYRKPGKKEAPELVLLTPGGLAELCEGRNDKDVLREFDRLGLLIKPKLTDLQANTNRWRAATSVRVPLQGVDGTRNAQRLSVDHPMGQPGPPGRVHEINELAYPDGAPCQPKHGAARPVRFIDGAHSGQPNRLIPLDRPVRPGWSG